MFKEFLSISCVFYCLIVIVSSSPVGVNTNNVPFYRRDYTYSSDMNAFYKAHNYRDTWNMAVSKCELEGAQLALPTSMEEIKIILDLVSRNDTHIWIGLHDLYSEGEFVTLDGTPATEIFTNWLKWQPDGANNKENCVEFNRDGQYNDCDCNAKRYYVCKRECSKAKINSNCETLDSGYVYNLSADRCFKVHTATKTWNDAYRTCKAEDSVLGIVNSREEVQIYKDLMNEKNSNWESIHIGITNIVNVDKFMTIDGKTLEQAGYDLWAPGMPKTPETNRCGDMNIEGKFTDVPCNNKQMFICEKYLKKDNHDNSITFVNSS